MPTYDDPITTEKQSIDETTMVYLVKCGDDQFSIKAVSSGLNQLTADPLTRAPYYWPINTNKLLEHVNSQIIFIDGELTTRLLNSQQVIEFLEIDTKTMVPTLFDLQGEMSNELLQAYAAHMDAHLAETSDDENPEVFDEQWHAIELGGYNEVNPYGFFPPQPGGGAAAAAAAGPVMDVNFTERLINRATGVGINLDRLRSFILLPQCWSVIQEGRISLHLNHDDLHKLRDITDSPACIQAIINQQIPLASLVALDLHILRAITESPVCIQAIINQQIPLASLAVLDLHILRAITESPVCIQAIINQQIPLASLAALDLHKLRAITGSPQCIKDIQDGLTTIESLVERDLGELRQAILHRSYINDANSPGLN